MKTITFICYDKYPKTTKFHIFKKRFSRTTTINEENEKYVL